MKDVLKELDKHPITKFNIGKQTNTTTNGVVRLLKLDTRTVHVTDLMTYIGASEEQKEVMKKLIGKYGVPVLREVFAEIFLKPSVDDRDKWVDMV